MKSSGSKLITMMNFIINDSNVLVEYDQETTDYVVTLKGRNREFTKIFRAFEVPVNGMSLFDYSKVQELVNEG